MRNPGPAGARDAAVATVLQSSDPRNLKLLQKYVQARTDLGDGRFSAQTLVPGSSLIPSAAALYVVGIAAPFSEAPRQRLKAFSPRCESDNSFAMTSFLAVSGVLKRFCFVSPYLLSRILRLLQRTARKMKAI